MELATLIFYIIIPACLGSSPVLSEVTWQFPVQSFINHVQTPELWFDPLQNKDIYFEFTTKIVWCNILSTTYACLTNGDIESTILNHICPMVFKYMNNYVMKLNMIKFARCNPISVISHYSDVIFSAMASKITGVSIVYSTVYSGAHQRKHQSWASLAFVRGIHRWPVYSPHKEPVTRKMFPFDCAIILAFTRAHCCLMISKPKLIFMSHTEICLHQWHYSDDTWAPRCLIPPATGLFAQ